MDEKLIENNIENQKFYLNTEEDDYKNLILKLKEINEKIALLRKTILS